MTETHRVAEADTIDLARAGDLEAVATLWRIYQPQLLRVLRAKRADSPEDVASQVWIDVARSFGRFEGDGNDFRRWLFTIGNRRQIDDHRRAWRHRIVENSAWPEASPAPGSDGEFEDSTSLDRALAIVRSLPSAMAEAVMLRVVYDLSVSDVAAIMDRPEGAVRVLVHRGLARLKDLLGDAPDQSVATELVGDTAVDEDHEPK